MFEIKIIWLCSVLGGFNFIFWLVNFFNWGIGVVVNFFVFLFGFCVGIFFVIVGVIVLIVGVGFILVNKEGGRGLSVFGGGVWFLLGEGGLMLLLFDVGCEMVILGDVFERGVVVELKVVRDVLKGVRELWWIVLIFVGIVVLVLDVRDLVRGDCLSEWKVFRFVFCMLSGRGWVLKIEGGDCVLGIGVEFVRFIVFEFDGIFMFLGIRLLVVENGFEFGICLGS